MIHFEPLSCDMHVENNYFVIKNVMHQSDSCFSKEAIPKWYNSNYRSSQIDCYSMNIEIPLN